MAGQKRAPDGWWKRDHIQRKIIKGRVYIYQYDPGTQKEVYLGAADPVYGTIDSMSAAQRREIIKMFKRGDNIEKIVEKIVDATGLPISRQSVYRWFRERGIFERWIR